YAADQLTPGDDKLCGHREVRIPRGPALLADQVQTVVDEDRRQTGAQDQRHQGVFREIVEHGCSLSTACVAPDRLNPSVRGAAQSRKRVEETAWPNFRVATRRAASRDWPTSTPGAGPTIPRPPWSTS